MCWVGLSLPGFRITHYEDRCNDVAIQNVWIDAITKLARFQVETDTGDLEALDCTIQDFSVLLEAVETLLQDAEALRGWGLTVKQTLDLAEAVPIVETAYERVAGLDLSMLPSHGDAHPMNALHGDAGTVWFDWGGVGLAHPFLDVGWFFARLSHSSKIRVPTGRHRPVFLQRLWQTYLESVGALEAGGLLEDAMVLALAHKALVSDQRYRNWTGTLPGWRPQFTPYCLRLLLGIIDRRHRRYSVAIQALDRCGTGRSDGSIRCP